MRKVRPLRFCQGIVYVPLTQGYEAMIDLQDVATVSGRLWCVKVKDAGRRFYAASRLRKGEVGYPKYFEMHRLILSPANHLEVDHANCNGLDNRRNNLRTATKSENGYNRKLTKGNTSGLKGASRCNPHKKWRSPRWKAQIKVEGKVISLGYYDTAEAAHAVYVEASNRLHGAFSRPN